MVSIHTPTKGVTPRARRKSGYRAVSIHTPTKGVTRLRKHIFKYYGVSIHTPTKGVTGSLLGNKRLSEVSIHTPTKGVTVLYRKHKNKRQCFNPHTHEGCDFRWVIQQNLADLFQSTHPRRV